MTMDESKVRGYCRCESVDDIKAFDPRPGDILLVGDKGYGHHITLIESVIYEEGFPVIGTIYGRFPDGASGQGVVKKTRHVEDKVVMTPFRRIIRPALSDFE